MSSRWDAVIIGSGISSLTCAVLLSQRGKKVCVLEQHTKPGGYMHCFSRFGHKFDTGAHYVGAMGPGQPFRVLLEYLGVFNEDLFVPLDPSGFDVFRFPDFDFELPKGYDEAVRALSDRFPSEKAAIDSYFRLIRQVVRNFPTYTFSDEIDPKMLAWSLETSLKTVVEQLTPNRGLQAVFYAYCALHSVLPSDVAFGLHAIVTDSLIRGPYGLAQGGDALTKRFIEVIEHNGGIVRTKKRVSRIENAGKLANAVITSDGERLEAEWIISGIHPKPTFELLSDPSALSPAFRERLSRIEESVGLFGVSAVVETQNAKVLNPLRNYYFFASDHPQEMFSIDSPETQPNAVFVSPARRSSSNANAPVCLNIHAAARFDWFRSWEGTRYGKRPKDYTDLKEKYASNILERIEGFEPGFKSSISKWTASSPMTNLHFNGTPEGSAYGLYHSMQNTGARALGPRTHVANLLLTGQNTLFPGLLGAAVGALRSAGHIIGIKPILHEIRSLGVDS